MYSAYIVLYLDKGYSAIVRSRSDGDVSDLLRNFLCKSARRKIHTQFCYIFFSFLRYLKKNHFLKSEKMHINLIKYIKIFEPYQNMEVSKLHQL